MDENDALSEYNKIPLGHNRTNSAVYSKINVKVEVTIKKLRMFVLSVILLLCVFSYG